MLTVIKFTILNLKMTVLSNHHIIPFILLLFVNLCAAAPSPLFHYPLNEGKGAIAADVANPGTAATLLGQGSSWSADTPSGRGFAYRITSSTPSGLSAPTPGSLSGLSDFTVTWWMKLSKAEVANEDRIFSTRASHRSGDGYIDLQVADDDLSRLRLKLVISNGHHTGRSEILSEPFDATRWIFVAITRRAHVGEVAILVGDPDPGPKLRPAGPFKATKATNINNGPSTEIRLGGYPGDSRNHSPDGLFQDWRFYREALTTQEIEAIHRQGLGIPAPPPATLTHP